VKILTRVGGDKSVPGLVALSLNDDDQEVRFSAMRGFSAEQQSRAIPLFVKALRSEFNPIVSRAGAALGVMGNDKAVGPLIDALITTHEYKVRVPDNSSTYSFSTDGRAAGGIALPPSVRRRIGWWPARSAGL